MLFFSFVVFYFDGCKDVESYDSILKSAIKIL